MWFFFALASAIIYAFRGILEKKIIAKTNKYVLGFAIRLFALPFFFIPFFFFPEKIIPITQLSWEFWTALVVICFINTPFETIFYYEALKEEEVSLVLPILSLSPILTIIFGTVILNEIPSFYGVIGVLLIIFGIYTLKIAQAKEGILQPLYHLKNSRGVRLMLIVVISYGISSIFDKMGVTHSNAYYYALFNYIGVSITLFIIAYIKARSHLKELILYKKQFFVIGCVVASYTLLYLLALQTGFASYSIAIRNASIIFTMILGYLFFKEKDIKQKIAAAIIISLGLILLKVFS